MKLTIIAATGGIGRELLQQAVAAGHDVTAVVRNPAKLSRPVRAITTDLTAPDQVALESAVAGADAVLSGLGPHSNSDAGIAFQGTRAIVAAMKTTGVRRIVAVSAAASQGRTASIIEIQALRALALAARGDHAGALGALTEAVTLARRHGYVRVLADGGAPMRALLVQLPVARPGQQHAAGRIDSGYLAALVPACGQSDAVSPRTLAAGAPPGLAEPLTGRELEVLRLLAAGRSNQRIAHDLVVALDTVKKHVTHVLGKLGAANRTEAVARARQLGLIP